jgi:hypothetical protein
LAQAVGSIEELFQHISSCSGEDNSDGFITAPRWAKAGRVLPAEVRQVVLVSLAEASCASPGAALAQSTLEALEVIALLESVGVPGEEE